MLGLAGVGSILYFNHKGSALPVGPAPIIQPQTLKPQTISGYPVRLIVPSLRMDLRVADGVYNPKNGSWTLSRDKAHFAVMTAVPNNEAGNTLIYGHYRPEVFARLKSIKPGEKAIIQTDNGYRFIYTFRESNKVAPTDTSILVYNGPPQLTLQTCTGIWMQNRHLFTFSFDKYEKI